MPLHKSVASNALRDAMVALMPQAVDTAHAPLLPVEW